MSARHDLSGRRFGRLVATRHHGSTPGGKPQWLCLCDCGKQHIVSANNLRRNSVRSCGCLAVESARRASSMRRSHGCTGTRLEGIWKDMNARCYNPRSRFFRRYGGRGIGICKQWRQERAAFFAWALSNGYAPGLSIDRVNNDGDYAPDNCRWATAKEQANNTPRNRFIEHAGRRLTLTQWAELSGIPMKRLWYRISAGWPFSNAIAN